MVRISQNEGGAGTFPDTCGSCRPGSCRQPRHAAASTPGGSFVEFVSTQAIKTKVIIGDADLKGGGDVRERLQVRCVS